MTCKQLLASDLLPPTENKAMSDVLRSLGDPENPQSKQLLNMLFHRKPDVMHDYVYDVKDRDLSLEDQTRWLSVRENITDRMRRVFQRHGAIELQPPLLVPVSTNTEQHDETMTLLDSSGYLNSRALLAALLIFLVVCDRKLVQLPYDLKEPFARYVSQRRISSMKRYVFDRVYREAVAGYQPKV